MSNTICISERDLIQQLKLSCQIPAIVESVLSRHIILQTAAKANLKVETEELQQAADNIRLITKLQTADETWEWLQKHYLTIDEFEELVYSNVISSKLAQHLFGDKVEAWFIERQLDYSGAVLYEAILEDTELATELFYALQEGEISFHEIARQYIQDPEQRRSGGYQGLCKRSELKPEISAAAFSAKPPQVLKPIVTSKGVHLILVEELVEPKLDDKLRYQILSEMFSHWLKQEMENFQAIVQLDIRTKAA